jgi:hypothetical protein
MVQLSLKAKKKEAPKIVEAKDHLSHKLEFEK